MQATGVLKMSRYGTQGIYIQLDQTRRNRFQ